MEILANNCHNVADEVGNVCLPDTFEVENGLVTPGASGADNSGDPVGLCLEDESMIANTKKRAFDEDAKDLQSPSKKLAVRSSSDALVDSVLFNSSLAEAMVIDTTWEETGEKESDNQPMPGSPKQISGSITACTSFCDPSPEADIHVSSGVSTTCETAQGVSVLQKVDDTSVSVDSNVDIPKSERDLIALNSAQLELKGIESTNGLTDSLELMKEEGVVEKEEDPLILENVPKNGHVIFEADVQVISNETVEESAVVGMDMEMSVPDTATDGGLLLSSPSGVEAEKTNGEFHVADASRSSMDDISASEVQITPLSLDSHTAQACQESVIANCATRCETTASRSSMDDMSAFEVQITPLFLDSHTAQACQESVIADCATRCETLVSRSSMDDVSASEVHITPLSLDSRTAQACQESVIADCAARCETTDEAGVDDENGSSEVDELQMEKTDAAKALELKMVEVIMQSPGFEVTESRNDGILNPLSDDPLTVREPVDGTGGKDTMIELSDGNKFADLFEPVVQLPEHLEGTNGFLPGTLDSVCLSNGQVSDDLHLRQGRHANKPILHSQDPHGAHVAPNRDLEFPELSGSDKEDNSMERQYSEVVMPSAATSAQSQSSGLKSLQLQLKMKGQGEIATKDFPNFAAGRGFPVKEILLKEAPSSAKLLLASGLLDGHYVRYLGRGGHVMLTGIIQEGGVLCDCSTCKGVQVVNVSAFEKHAGSSARHPSDFIFLENGKCLKDILEIGWNANKQKMNVMDVLKSAIGEIGGENIKIRSQEYPMLLNQSVEKKPRLFPDTKPRLPLDTSPRVPQDIKPSLAQEVKPKLPQEIIPRLPQEMNPRLPQEMNPRLPQEMNPRLPQEMKPRLPQEMKPRLPQETKPRLPQDIKPRPTVEVKAKGSEGRATQPRDRAIREKETASPPVLSRETSGANLHKALFLPGGLEDDTELGYYVKGQKFQSGVKKGAGICCGCCQQVISCSLFEQHAGWGSRRNPYTSIYLADGRSLHDAAQSLVVEQTVKQEGITPTKIEHLDQCVECGDSADLLLCTGCPNAYHQDCLGLADSSTGDFFCPDCQEQRFGGTKDRRRSMVKRRSKGAAKTLLTRDRVTGRSARLLQVPEAIVLGGCVFCKSGDFAKSGFGPMTTLLCDQCEREYHVGCLKMHGLEDLKELPEGEWFCGQDCKHIHSILSLLVSNGPEPLADSVISKVLKSQPRPDKSEEAVESSIAAFEWQLLHGRGGDPSNGKTLAEAVQIFSECFDPIADGRSGGDLIPLMVYRRSIRDQDFGGIYCVVLKQDNKVVSTALVRVFGRQLAELPLLATNPSHQGQGHCKALLLSIERLLGVLRVQRLALPAAEGAEGIWLNKFGFRRMPEDQVQQFHTNLNMMIFTGSIMLEKAITPLEITGGRKA